MIGRGLQAFIGGSNWDWSPHIGTLVDHVARECGDAHGALVLMPWSFEKTGIASVGVARQRLYQAGRLANCQQAVYCGYASPLGQALVDTRLYLPTEWIDDSARRLAAGVPPKTKFRTLEQLALDMLLMHLERLPHRWIAADQVFGAAPQFRRQLHAAGEQYLVAVPASTLPYKLRVEMNTRLDNDTSTAVSVPTNDDADESEFALNAVSVPLPRRGGCRKGGTAETLVAVRVSEWGLTRYRYLLSDAPCDTPLEEFLRVAESLACVRDCLWRAESAAGLADFEGRTFRAWYHHQTLALIATWFLVLESRVVRADVSVQMP